MLTRSTQIPTSVRGKVRALVKAHKHWPVFLHKEGLISASAKNADLIRYALYYPELTAQIEALINPTDNSPARVTWRLQQLLMIAQRHLDEAALDDFNYVGSRHHY